MSDLNLMLRLELTGDAAFGRGDGVAGLVDKDVQHDVLGLPFLHGRTVKGLLRAQCGEVLGALHLAGHVRCADIEAAGLSLFGSPGSDLESNGALVFGHACLPVELAQALRPLVEDGRLARQDVLGALTGIRRQTRIGDTGAAAEDTLRSTRILRRGLVFRAPIYAESDLSPVQRGLLAACVRSLRHVGTHRARGLGQAHATLLAAGQEVTSVWMVEFQKELQCLQ